jgi:hypothetical protein
LYLSAAGSFAMSLLLSAVGAASIARSPARRRMFAAIPFLFAVQQAAEGAVWLTMGDPRSAVLHAIAVNLFLGIGLVVWPTWLPLALSLIEQKPFRQWSLESLSRFGTVVSTCAAVLLLRWRPGARIVAHGITYDSLPGQDLADQLICLSAYGVAVIVPLFVSTERSMRTMGLLLVAALVVAGAVPPSARTSVWGFFAAVSSCLVLAAEWRERRADAPIRAVPSRASVCS